MFDFPIFAGLLASSLHVISGPDHLAAVTPLVIESKKRAWKIGLFWGLGHLLGMLLIGVLFLLFKDVIPVDTISSYSEQLVAIVLIGIGVWAFYCIFHKKKELYSVEGDQQKLSAIQQSSLSSLGIGFIHGLAGIVHFLLLFPVLGFENVSESMQYLFGFAAGTVFAMTFYTFVLELLTYFSKKRQHHIFEGIRLAGGLFALIVGFYWL